MQTPRIKQLPPEVYNKIKAGEVIHYPKNCVKELLENSLDAGSTSITILLKSGGIDKILINDNGHGITKDDMDILCQAHSTSKLEEYTDLQNMQTYGFRGEALSSMTYVANVQITSKPSSQNIAFFAEYKNGMIEGKKKPCAGSNGTIIKIENLFYQNPTRKSQLKSNKEEKRVVKLVQYYSLHNSGVSICLKKERKNKLLLKTDKNANVKDNIRKLFGKKIFDEITNIEFKSDVYKFSCKAYFTQANYHSKSSCFLLFINNRLVECRNLKNAVESVFETYLPKGSKPWVYIDLKLLPNTVDVNVSVTKDKVGFLNEEEIIVEIQNKIREKLLNSNNSRVYIAKTQLSLSGKPITPKTNRKRKRNQYQNDIVRKVDEQQGDIEKYLNSNKKKRPIQSEPYQHPKKKQKIDENEKEYKLKSVYNIEMKLASNSSNTLSEIFKKHIYVGWVNADISLIQHEKRLYAIDVQKLSEQIMFESFLKNITKFRKFVFNPIDIREMIQLSMEYNDVNLQKLNSQFNKFLKMDKMFEEYFKMEIKEGKLSSLPQLLINHILPLHRIPDFLLHIVYNVNYDSEDDCIEGIGKVFARFYRLSKESELVKNIPKQQQLQNSQQQMDQRRDVENFVKGYDQKSLKWITKTVIFPSLKRSIIQAPKNWMDDGTIIEVANLQELYKIFERC